MATTDYREFARRMLTHDRAAPATAGECASAVGSVHQRLHHRLAPLVGAAGVRALLARSVAFTSKEYPPLAAIPDQDSGDSARAAESLVQLLSQFEYAVAWEIAQALYANFIGLVVSLLGERLVLVVLQRAFPNIDVSTQQEPEK